MTELDMPPRLALDSQAHGHVADAVFAGHRRNGFPPSVPIAAGQHDVIGQLGCRLTPPTGSGAIAPLVGAVLHLRAPAEVDEPVIQLAARSVAALHVIRPRANECLKDQPVDEAGEPSAIALEIEPQITIRTGLRAKDAPSLDGSATCPAGFPAISATDPAEIRYLVEPFPSGYGPPSPLTLVPI